LATRAQRTTDASATSAEAFSSPVHERTWVGADGCRGGRWIAAITNADGSRWTLDVFDSTQRLVEACPAARLILLDVPIGLLDGPRACDTLAKRLLGRQHSRVFPAPARSCLSAKSWSETNAISRRVAGVGLSKQAWNLVPRIREVDELLRREPDLQRRVRECHPEVCFSRLARGPVRSSKKRAEGIEERLDLLRPVVAGATELVAWALARWPRSVLSADDVVDALAAGVTAFLAGTGRGDSMPATPALDGHGLPMQMTQPNAETISDLRVEVRPAAVASRSCSGRATARPA
jgi:predicted RNase H-like nuclease